MNFGVVELLKIRYAEDKSEDIKLPGVHIDDDLDSKQHIRELCNKTSQKVGILSRLRHLIPSKVKLLLYEAFILPHLTYCHLLSSDKRKVERIQERALSRLIYRSHSDTYEELLERANLPTLYNKLQDIVVLIYKVKYGSIYRSLLMV